MPSSIYETIPNTGATLDLTAPADGYYTIYKRVTSASSSIIARNLTTNVSNEATCAYYNVKSVPCKRGDVVHLDCDNFSMVLAMYFTYTVGEAKRLRLL